MTVATDHLSINVDPGDDVEVPEIAAPSPDGSGSPDEVDQPDGQPESSGDGEESPPTIPPWMVKIGVVAAFDAAASRRGEHWKISDEEAERIAEPAAGELSDLADRIPFLSGAGEALGERRTALLVALGAAIAPRYWHDITIAKDTAAAVQRDVASPTPIRSEFDPPEVIAEDRSAWGTPNGAPSLADELDAKQRDGQPGE